MTNIKNGTFYFDETLNLNDIDSKNIKLVLVIARFWVQKMDIFKIIMAGSI